jgi:predicted dehydrogenase
MTKTSPAAVNDTERLDQKLRLGFLGLGWIGLNRMRCLRESKAAEICAISDPCGEAVDAARAVAPEARVAADLDGLLRQPLNGLVIATPSALHAGQARQALEAGLAVFCQKPLGRTTAETAKVVDAARRADRLLGVDFSYRYTRAVATIRQEIAAGGIGDIFAADLVFHNAYGPDKNWFYVLDQSGGGCVMDLGIHLIDLALWLLDYPDIENVCSRLFARGRPVSADEACVEDFAIATATAGTGAVIRLACSWKLDAGCDAVIGGTFYGTKGSLALSNVNGSFYDFIAEARFGTTARQLAAPPDDWGGRAAVSWAKQLGRSRCFDPAATRQIQTAKVIDRIYGRERAAV